MSLAAGDPVLAARLLIDDWTAGRVLSREDDRRWPVALVLPECTGPDAAVLRAAAALGVDAAPAGADLALAAAATADTSARPALRISAAVVCAAAGDRGAPGVQAAAETAPKLLAELPEEHRGRRELAAVLATAEAAALLRTDAADATLAEALRAAVASGRRAGAGRPLARCLGALALLEALQGRLRTAADLLAGHEALCAEWRLPPATQTPAAAIAAAWVAAERGEQADARRGLAGVLQRGTHPDAAVTAPLLAVLASRQRRARGELDAAEQAMRRVPAATALPAWVGVQVTVERVRLCFARRQADQVLRWVGELGADPHATMLQATAAALGLCAAPALPPVPPGAHLLAVAVEVGIARACLHAEVGDIHAAVTGLAHALRQAEPERLRRPFQDAPPQLRQLLRRQPHLAAAAAWLNPTATPAPPSPRPVAAGTSVPLAAAPPQIPPELSGREREVLQCLAEMLSTAEIAAALFVSINTVRTHIRSILRKLAVGRRSEAVRRGRELGLLPQGRRPATVTETEPLNCRTGTAG